ncbi:hypothetical protein EJ08DRAFT_652039 [Tothia fuscella]|uniref:Histidine kinase n=1 Tax=Tothia fuscella TaxID=1048955 RepID=A0A9P4TW28_9PEZI|nr:hypothetical protein EJ08DRAFT_652039 [Tothia fuscella]
MAINDSQVALSEPAREHAVYTYYNPTDIIQDFFPLYTEVPETKLPPADYLPKACSDTTLTALAQLATVQLKAARSIVSLIDSSHQYILTEATPSLSLEPGPHPKGSETLWLGAMIIPRAYGLCQRTLELPYNLDPPASIIVNDLHEDAGFDSNCLAANAPRSRFYASIPLRTDEGLVIGAVSILDEEPRNGLSPESLRTFHDITQMIFSYLKTCKLRADQNRSDKMIRGLTSFMSRGAPENVASKNSQQQIVKGNAHSGDQAGRAIGNTNGHSYPQKSQGITASSVPAIRSKSVRRLTLQGATNNAEPPQDQNSGSSGEESKKAKTNKLREKMLPDNAKSMFSKAAETIRINCNYLGVVIFDSTLSTFQSQVSAPSEHDKGADKGAGPECHILGYSSNDTSHEPRIAESDLHALSAMHPTGRIYSISRTGEVSSEEQDLHAHPPFTYSGYKNSQPRGQRSGERMEAEVIRSLAPNARSLVFFPLYDFRRGRWFAGAFCWIGEYDRVLSPELDLLYLRAFGNTMMTELSRLDAVSGEQAKTTFISSISHELRSPLHGILGGVEFLQDTEIDDFQTSMVNSIDVCGRTLLNTINHVMDFAKINHFATEKTKTDGQKDRSTSSQRLRNRPTDMSSLTSIVDLSVTIEETVEAVFLGESYRVTHPKTTDLDSNIKSMDSPGLFAAARKTLHVILDLPKRDNWQYSTQPGSWKRILMNLTGNALKYTETGFVRVSIDFENDEDDYLQSIVMTVQDSGIGISAEFLQSRLFKPFSQENSFATGTGLGLSIVRQIVDSMGGSIDLRSQQGVGTEVKVTLPAPDAVDFPPGSRVEKLASTLAHTRQKRICIFNRELSAEELKEDTTSGDYSKVTESLAATLTNWLEMDVSVATELSGDPADIFLCTEPSFGLIAALRKKHPRGNVPIVLLMAIDTMEAATLRADARVNSKESVVEIITQPCGPYKLAEVLARGLKRNLLIAAEPSISTAEAANATSGADKISASVLRTEDPIEKVVSAPLSVLVETPAAKSPIRDSSLVQVNEVHTDENHILIVDDNAVNIRLLVAFMRKNKFKYAEALNGLEALNTYKAANGAFNTILMDLSMPIMDGTTSSREIRKYEREKGLKPTTIIALTGLASATARIEALANGIDHYMTKPVKLKKLLAYLQGVTGDPNVDAS